MIEYNNATRSFEELNPIFQAESIQWFDAQWKRVCREGCQIARAKFLSHFLTESAQECAGGISLIAAYTFGLDNIPMKYRDKANDDAEHILRELEFPPKILQEFESCSAQGVLWLKTMVLPHRGNIIAQLYPTFVSEEAHFRKASNRVYLFLKALGKPDDALRQEFIKDICKISDVSSSGPGKLAYRGGSLYEQHLMLDTSEGGITSTVYLDFYIGPVNGIVIVRNGENFGRYIISTRRELSNEKYTQTDDIVGNPDGERYAEYFDLLVNAWVAEKTGMIVTGAENSSEKARVTNIINSAYKYEHKDDGVAYEYIKVTDKAWAMHTESQAAFREHCDDRSWKKEFWWRRGHFAIRGGHEVIIKGHWCHRRCGEVEEAEDPKVIEVLG